MRLDSDGGQPPRRRTNHQGPWTTITKITLKENHSPRTLRQQSPKPPRRRTDHQGPWTAITKITLKENQSPRTVVCEWWGRCCERIAARWGHVPADCGQRRVWGYGGLKPLEMGSGSLTPTGKPGRQRTTLLLLERVATCGHGYADAACVNDCGDATMMCGHGCGRK